MSNGSFMMLEEGTWLFEWGSGKKAWVYSSSSGMSWASAVEDFLPIPSNFTATKLSVPVSTPAQLRAYVCSQVGAGTTIYTYDLANPTGTSGSQTCPS